MSHQGIQVLFRREEESWGRFARRIRETEGSLVVVLGAADTSLFLQEEQRALFLEECAKLKQRVRIATRQPLVLAAARNLGIRVFDRTKALKRALAHHPQCEEAVRVFSPSLWRQQWRTRLQSAGLLSLPRVRILLLISLSAVLFLFVMFRLLPSAEVRVWPRGDMTTQTMNILLVQSGATALPSHIRTLPLYPIIVTVHQPLVFDQISKQFTGTNAEVPMTLVNKTPDPFPLLKGTRLRNQAGMIFKTQKSVTVPSNGTMTVLSTADTLDAYGEIVGERGNVPANLKWELPGLDEEERKHIYAENRIAAKGGATSYRTVLQRDDIDTARKRLERELLAQAKKLADERITATNLMEGKNLRLFTHEQLVQSSFTGVVLPLHLINTPVASITVEGTLVHSALAYDAAAILDVIRKELVMRIPADKRLLEDTVTLKQLEIRVFDYADDLQWIKATAEIAATEQFILDPLSPSGAQFARDVREKIQGLGEEEAVRILKNLPEVEKVAIELWPPWGRLLPSIPSSISIVPQK
ncbi:MAG: hypothetical protein WCV62_03400 [Candidatus Peribacteraceae bacterium]|jgi:hypothetical protein